MLGLVVSALSGIGFGLGTDYPALVVTAAAIFSAGTIYSQCINLFAVFYVCLHCVDMCAVSVSLPASVTAWNSLDVMSVEDFPTPVRASAMGCLAAAGR